MLFLSYSVTRGTKKAYQLAITHFDNNRIVYSCIAFLELLSVDTMFLRIDVAAAKRCLHPGNKEELQCSTIEELKNAVVAKLLRCARDNEEKPKVLVRILESSTKNIISKEGLERLVGLKSTTVQVEGSKFKVQCSKLIILSLRFKVQSSKLKVQSLRFKV